MQLHQKRRLLRQCQHPLLHHRTFHIIVLNDYVLFQNLNSKQIVRSLAFGQHDFAEGTLAEYHKEIEVGRTNEILFGHVVRQVLVVGRRCPFGDGCFLYIADEMKFTEYRKRVHLIAYSHLTLQLHQVGSFLWHWNVVKLSFLGCKQFEPAIGRILCICIQTKLSKHISKCIS